MIIQHNIMALNAHRQLGGNNTAVSKNLEKLSSGFKINRAGDDAAGLAISEKMRAQIKGLERAQANAQDGISLVQSAEGALTEVHSMLNRMVELATQSANGTYKDDVDRDALQSEVDSLNAEINRIAEYTDFNGIKLLDGTVGGYNATNIPAAAGIHGANPATVSGGKLAAGDVVNFTIAADGKVTIKDLNGDAPGAAGITANGDAKNPTGAGTFKFTISMNKATATAEDYEKWNGVEISFTSIGNGAPTDVAFTVAANADGNIGGGLNLQIGDSASQQINVSIADMGTKALGIDTISIGTEAGAKNAIQTIKDAINKVSTNRSNLGAVQNRLEHTINNLGVTTENMTAAESRIRDVDMAKEMMAFTKNNVLTQAAQAMLAQANQQPQSVLQLLR
ncbi:flagellin [Hydrogenoanaerobacterium saccharovorans]|uniref:Flagellin n=1 Tax=Hydrogenoanaerobacterium saccharovorans TaxID=474960 RepID=A0A1H7ZWK5_9FIRM|nr:flagellin [Hydrogenoanaerobacterium saccharovorans]RPF48367.1 flagellin [Hydrogenoanaerobacterium saccharovorans]SEM62124.1 flagellin [Hydrogenoanaerobacterium saccharovorans]